MLQWKPIVGDIMLWGTEKFHVSDNIVLYEFIISLMLISQI